jgi:catechol 2,3-dioxygenase-like lactoylglutathione lyase family enzyme
MIQSIDHTALSVADLERSIRFYRDLLGFTLVRILEPAPELPLGRVVGMPGAKARIAHLEFGGKMLELFEYQEPAGRPPPPDTRQADLGWIHMGLTSTDTREDYRRLADAGVQFFSEPVEFRPDVWIVYFAGPDGEVMELRQT